MKKISLLIFVLIARASASADLDYITEISKSEDAAKKLGIAKLSTAERAEWNKLLAGVYQLGIESVKNSSTAKSSAANPKPSIGPGGTESSGSIWVSKADLEGKEIVKLRNGAIFEVAVGLVGYGYGRDIALIKEGPRWSLWIEGKREFRGTLLKAPEVGRPASFKRSSIDSVSSDGSIVKLLDGSIYEVDSIGRIDTSLWLSGSEVFVVNDTALLNASGDGGGIIQTRSLK